MRDRLIRFRSTHRRIAAPLRISHHKASPATGGGWSPPVKDADLERVEHHPQQHKKGKKKH